MKRIAMLAVFALLLGIGGAAYAVPNCTIGSRGSPVPSERPLPTTIVSTCTR